VQIELVRGDIVQEEVDAVVTAANETLTGGGGVDWAVHTAAGPELARAGAKIAPCQPGNAMATESFGLAPRIRWVIHAVGPVWDGGAYDEADLLASCYRRILEVADDLGARTLSIPAISTGLYGYPVDAAARVAVRTLRSTPSSVERVRLVAFDDENYDALESAMVDEGDG
jgi:O-acetyl-ADP-ribose deacetylase (regulator of RNase III)